MNQQSLFAIQLVDEIDSPFVSKDAKAIGIDAAENEYMLKRLQEGALLPLTEWLGHHLCRLCGIPTPEFTVVLRPNGEPAFGSKIDYALVDFNRDTLSEADKSSLVVHTADSISRSLILDVFFPNPDRHFGNWLFARRRDRFTALAIDWSRVTALYDPLLTDWPWQEGCVSNQSLASLHKLGAFSVDAVRRTAEALSQVNEDDISSIMSSAPLIWRANFDERGMLSWWRVHHAQRIQNSLDMLLIT